MSVNLFFSYLHKDIFFFRIDYIARKLKSYPEIGEVLYFEASAKRSIPNYMSEGIQDCDVFILFCSPEALNSLAVGQEWGEAVSLHKEIIPVFMNEESIPPIIKQYLGIPFDGYYIDETIRALYELILKRTNVEKIIIPQRPTEGDEFKKKLDYLFSQLLKIELIEGLSLVSVEGLYIADIFKDKTIDSTRVAAMSGSFISISERLSMELNMSIPRRTIIDSERGFILIYPCGPEMLLTISVASKEDYILNSIDWIYTLIKKL